MRSRLLFLVILRVLGVWMLVEAIASAGVFVLPFDDASSWPFVLFSVGVQVAVGVWALAGAPPLSSRLRWPDEPEVEATGEAPVPVDWRRLSLQLAGWWLVIQAVPELAQVLPVFQVGRWDSVQLWRTLIVVAAATACFVLAARQRAERTA